MICVSLAGLTFQECLMALNNYDFAELRIDLLNIPEDKIKELFSTNKKTIATFRSLNMDQSSYKAHILKMAVLAGANYIDLEYELPTPIREELTNFAHQNNTQVIISYHNFECTPASEELHFIINQSKEWRADLVKITTTAKKIKDCSLILGLYALNNNIIAFCMGQLGKITRIAAPMLGAPFTYASYNEQLSTAPGQLTVEELAGIYSIING